MIYVFGNSHVNSFTNRPAYVNGFGFDSNNIFTSYCANLQCPDKRYPHVMSHKFIERFFPSIISAINRCNIDDEKDYVMLVVGEIDCRWHLPKKIVTKNIDLFTAVSENVINFFPAILHIKNSGCPIIGWGVHPSTTKDHSDEAAIYGDCILRNTITHTWNNCLRLLCKKYDIKFVSIFEDLIDSNGMTKMEYFYDEQHLNHKAMPIILNKLKQQNII